MTKIKSTLAATLLTLVLAIPSLAGNIGTPGATPPPPPTSDGNIGTPGSPEPGDIGSGLEPALVDILIAVLSLI